MNWQSSFSKDNKRVNPDKDWDFASGDAQPGLAVWETYIHRTELRPANGERTADLNTGKPKYSFIDSTKINYKKNGITLDEYWNVLDEDNEIGSAYVFAHKNKHEVLYAAKTNLVEYNYVKQYFPTDTELQAAGNRGAAKGLEYFTELTNAQMCDSEGMSKDSDTSLICLPCSDDASEGAIEIKLAFRKLDESLGDDPSRFITKDVVVFKPVNLLGSEYERVAVTETFGLIGMHIIRKTKNYPAFIFASWEQVDERNNGIQTIGLDTVQVNNQMGLTDVEPKRLNPVIERVIPETLQAVNSAVHQKIRSKNSASKWQYYQLIGVQGTPIDYENRTSDNNYFMANYVIESDLKLTNFHGSFGDPFDTSVQNVAFNQQSFNMGGCQGCHGQAQVSFGTDFSFLLDFGAGKPTTLPDPYQTCQEACLATCTKPNGGGIDTDCVKTCTAGCDANIVSEFTPKKKSEVLAYIKTLDKK